MKKSHIGLVGAGVLALILAGCTPAVSNGPGSGPSAAEGPAGACIPQVKADVEAASKPSKLVAPTAGLDLAALTGKNIWYITNSQNQFSTEMSTGVKEAGAAAGVKITVFDGQNSTSKYSEGINQAIAQGADGIVLMAIQPAVVKEDLAAAAAAGIKVLNTLNGDPDEAVPASTFANLSAQYTKDGELMGKWALLDSNCKANIIVVQSSPVHVWDLAAKGITKAVTDLCPKDCKVKVLDIDPANIATDTGRQLQTALQVDPDVNYVLPVWDSSMPYVAPAVAAAGSKAKVLAHDGISDSLKLIASGKDQVGTVAMPPPGWIGWAAFDEVARAIVGDKSPNYVIPTRLVTKSNVGDGGIADVSPNYRDYQSAFKEAWSK
jgi:ribose transport system substrate-binding protein